MTAGTSEISFVVNSENITISAAPGRSLLNVLREDLNLTGTKQGCSEGHCGTCNVLVDGKVVKSCHYPVEKAAGKSILTIEGLGTKDKLHPIQQAFIQAGAVQCGFCTPGMVIAAKGLLDQNPNPSRDEIKQAFQSNLCRCTGYVKIIDAVERAAQALQGGAPFYHPDTGPRIVGQSVPRVDAAEKVTGGAIYAADIKIPGMLHGYVVRSPYHHARIKNIDKKVALAVPGVSAVLTASDVPGTNRVKIFRPDWPILAEDKVRFLGDAVALVLAESEEIAQAAADLVRVEYEELEAFWDPHAAAKSGELIHADSDNVAFSQQLVQGDTKSSFAAADLVLENTYTTAANEHAYLEPEAGVAYLDNDGVLVVQVGTQNAQHLRGELAEALNLPVNKIRVIQTVTGGGFGGKLDISIQGLLAVAAWVVKKPVKIVFSRQESFLATTKRHPFYIRHRLAARQDGTLTGLEVEFLADTGAYLSFGPGVVIRAVVHATGPYRIPNVHVLGQAVYTNNAPGGAMRGFGVPQMGFAMECQMDILAERLGLDPLELRRRNGFVACDITAIGQQLEKQVGYLDTLEDIRADFEAAKGWALNQPPDLPVKRGVGIASMWFGPGKTGLAEKSEVCLELQPGGTVRLITTAADIGQGLDTAMAQLVAQAMNLPYDMVEVSTKDTFESPDGGFTCASRQTYNTGNAALRAATALERALLQAASPILGELSDNLELREGLVRIKSRPDAAVSLKQLYGAGIPRVYGNYAAEVTQLDENGQGIGYETYTFGTQMAEVEVNTATGEVKVLRVVACHDAGTPINPQNVEGQLEGGVVMGLGMALKEEYIHGKTRNFGSYHIPRFKDVPEVKVIHLDVQHERGPYGAAGAGECSLIPTAPAIINAVSRALGHRFSDLPVTAKQVRAAAENMDPQKTK